MVGESGCGKSVTAFSIMQLLKKPGEICSGEILFDGADLLRLDEKKMQALRGSAISMIFQEPMTSLNPVLRIGDQITEAIRSHRNVAKAVANAEAVSLLKQVGIPAAEERFSSYPHQLSGGMKQRAMIAMALACKPRLLIADEPTTALDVTIQAQILELIDSLKETAGMSLLLITHNLGIVANRADRTVIMYAGTAVEAVNLVRERVGMSSLSSVNNDQVMDEKYAELAMEWGTRFYDMVRLGKYDELNYDGRTGFGEDKIFLPYPQNQVDQLPILDQ